MAVLYMRKDKPSPSKLAVRQAFSELVSTSILVFIQCILAYAWRNEFEPGGRIPIGQGLSLAGFASASGAVVTGLCYAFGHLSGPHLNHAVTLGVASRGHVSTAQFLAYLVMPVAGSFAGAGLFVACFGRAALDQAAPYPIGISNDKAFFLEFLLSSSLALIVTLTGTRGRSAALHYSLAYGGGTAAVIAAGAAFGARANPTVALGPALLSIHRRSTWWIYLFAPWLGGFNAAVLAGLLGGTSQEGPGLAAWSDPGRREDEKSVMMGWDSTARRLGNMTVQAGPLFEDDLLAQQAGESSAQDRW